MKHSRRTIILVASLLTVLASGDDFNVTRLVWTYAVGQVPCASLSLDDENPDFITTPRAKELGRQVSAHVSVVCVANAGHLILPGFMARIENRLANIDHLHCDSFFTPLRC